MPVLNPVQFNVLVPVTLVTVKTSDVILVGVFVFNNPDKCTDFAAKYFSDSGFVNARSYAGKMRDFKALLYSVIPRAR